MSTRAIKLAKLVAANITATHAYQVLLAKKAAIGGENWNDYGLTGAELEALVAQQKELLARPERTFQLWAGGKRVEDGPGKTISAILRSKLKAAAPQLPVHVFRVWLKTAAPNAGDAQINSVAGLLQMSLDINRDGGVLQDMYRTYNALKLPVHLGQLGLPAGTLEECLAYGKELAPRIAPCPFAADAAAIQILCAKMHNWGRRYTGERDKTVLARELLAEDAVKALLPALQTLPAQKIAVIGHSFTMDVNWSSPSAFVPVVSEIFKAVNPKVEIRQWQRGGLTTAQAYGQFKYYDEVLAWKPDRVLLVMLATTPEDDAALDAMVRGCVQAGIKIALFDRLRAEPDAFPSACRGNAKCEGADVIPVGAVLNASPDRAKFVSLDGIHMTEPYHRLMAKEWLKYLAAGPK